ncbi:hypothetical protein U9M48_019493 [Paspalum notatum var. saurae]|uniref:Uncharacterized protein n=1 Tax=Paspalum notatum var. saurae TaxID=547442 RepID=A0AAQ3WQS6_PASNO
MRISGRDSYPFSIQIQRNSKPEKEKGKKKKEGEPGRPAGPADRPAQPRASSPRLGRPGQPHAPAPPAGPPADRPPPRAPSLHPGRKAGPRPRLPPPLSASRRRADPTVGAVSLLPPDISRAFLPPLGHVRARASRAESASRPGSPFSLAFLHCRVRPSKPPSGITAAVLIPFGRGSIKPTPRLASVPFASPPELLPSRALSSSQSSPEPRLEDQAAAQGQDGGQAQQQQNENEDRWNESVHRWFDYPLPFPRMLREALVRLRLGHAWVTYVGTRYRHRIYQEEWAMAVRISVLDEYGARRDIALAYAPALRHNYEAAIGDAAREALTTLCYSCHGPPGGLDAWIVTPTAEKNPRLEAIVDYLVALNTDYNALAEELCTAKLEISRLRAQITPSMPLFNPVYYPPRKRVRYNDPTARTYIRHP